MDNIKYNTQRFNSVGECIEFLKGYKEVNSYGNNGLNVLSDFEIYDIIEYLNMFLERR